MRGRGQLLIPKEQQLQQQPSNTGTGKSIQPIQFKKTQEMEMQRALLPCLGIPLRAWTGEHKGRGLSSHGFT